MRIIMHIKTLRAVLSNAWQMGSVQPAPVQAQTLPRFPRVSFITLGGAHKTADDNTGAALSGTSKQINRRALLSLGMRSNGEQG